MSWLAQPNRSLQITHRSQVAVSGNVGSASVKLLGVPRLALAWPCR